MILRHLATLNDPHDSGTLTLSADKDDDAMFSVSALDFERFMAETDTGCSKRCFHHQQ